LALLLSESQSEPSLAEALRWAQRDWEVRQDATAADTLAWAHHVNGHGLEALELSRRARQSGSKPPALSLHGGLIERRWGDPKKGDALLQQAEACPATYGPHERKLIGMME
jgi:hypothetical protein